MVFVHVGCHLGVSEEGLIAEAAIEGIGAFGRKMVLEDVLNAVTNHFEVLVAEEAMFFSWDYE